MSSKKAVLKGQSTSLQTGSTTSSKDSSQPAQDLDVRESSIMAQSQSRKVPMMWPKWLAKVRP